MAHKYGASAQGFKAPKRNATGGGQFDAGNSGGGVQKSAKSGTNRDPSSGESRNAAGIHRTGTERRAGTAKKP